MRWPLILALAGAILVLAVACGDGGGGSDEEQIGQLNQDVFRHLKDERWSKMYELYSQEFQARCPRDEFLGGMLIGKALLGEGEWEDLLKEMKLIAVDNIQVGGDTAMADVTAEVLGERETRTQHYVKEDGRWRLAPDPGTEGCQTEADEEEIPSPLPAGTPTVLPTAPSAGTPRATATSEATPTPAVGRSRSNPIPLGETAVVPPGWEVTVLNVDPDAWPEIQAESMFNDPPEEGYRMFMVTVRVTNVQGGDETDIISSYDFDMVGSRNEVYGGMEHYCGVMPNELGAELFPEGTTEGNVCTQNPTDETGLLLIASISWDKEDRRYFALQ